MFEALARRASAAAARRARETSEKLAERMAAELPPGISAEASEEGVRLSGRDLRRRMALELGLRWIRGGWR